jgi:hypothetical protein
VWRCKEFYIQILGREHLSSGVCGAISMCESSTLRPIKVCELVDTQSRTNGYLSVQLAWAFTQIHFTFCQPSNFSQRFAPEKINTGNDLDNGLFDFTDARVEMVTKEEVMRAAATITGSC